MLGVNWGNINLMNMSFVKGEREREREKERERERERESYMYKCS